MAGRAGLIVQGYLGDNDISETRVAIRDNHGWLFVKSKGILSRTGWMNSQSYNEDLTLKGCPDSPFTINKVYDRTNPYTHGKHYGPHSLNDSLEDDLVLVWDRNSALDIVEDLERVVELIGGTVVNLDAIAYFDEEFVYFSSPLHSLAIDEEDYNTLRDYAIKNYESGFDALNQTDSRTY